jgi:predicted nucleic acid-binding Zn ribbon protein
MAAPVSPPVAAPAAAPVPLPVYPPATAPVAAPAPAGVRTCTACGNAIKPGDRFCSKCLVLVKDTPPAAMPVSSPVAAPAAAPVPLPVAAPATAGVRTCTACGNAIKPGDKFCSKCLVIVRDAPPAAAPVPPQIPTAPAGKFCGSCGAALSGNARFCGGCGAPVGASFPAGAVITPAPATPSPPPGGEQVIGVIGYARKMKMLGISYDTYNLIITDRRMIIAQLTQEMLNAAIAEAQAQAKAEGKGFFGIMGDQMAASFQYARRYETMPPDAALQETPGNIAIENAAITALYLKLYDDENTTQSEFRLTIKSSTGKNEFRIGEDDRFINTLKTAYGDRVHMPFGYFRAGGIKIKLF